MPDHHLETLDVLDRDLLARALLEATRSALAGRALEFTARDVPELMSLRDRVRPAYGRNGGLA